MHHFLFTVLIIFILGSCASEKKTIQRKINFRSSWIHPLYFQEECRNNLSLPFWFNSNTLRLNKVSSLSITQFEVEEDESKKVSKTPKFIKEYFFDTNGKLKTLNESQFREGLLIGFQQFEFISNKGAFCKVVPRFKGVKTENKIYQFVTSKENFYSLINTKTKNKTHVVTKELAWKTLKIAKLIRPASRDLIVWGKMTRPVRMYKMENVVKEKEVTNYYYNSKNFPKQIISSNYPFKIHRSFNYFKGEFVSYTDSTFIDDNFVTFSSCKLVFNSKQVPIKIIHSKAHANTQSSNKNEETISITYFK